MSKLPIFNGFNPQNFSTMQTKWSADINPVLNADIVNGLLITGINISTTATIVNHMLQRNYKGWIITRKYNGFSDVNDQPTNAPDKFINLIGNNTCTIDIWVF